MARARSPATTTTTAVRICLSFVVEPELFTTTMATEVFLTRLPRRRSRTSRRFTRDGFCRLRSRWGSRHLYRWSIAFLLRNNGDRTFTDYTAQAKLTEKITAHSVVPTDFDNRRDIDLLVASSEKVSLWRNMRDGTFRDVAAEVGLGEVKGSSSVAAGDVNKDGFTDFYFGGAGFALSRGNARFQFVRAPASETTAQFLDYDNDGLLDLVTSSTTQIRISRNTGNAFAQVATIPSGPSPFLHQVILITTATRIWLLGSRAADCESRAMTVATQTDRCEYLWPARSVIALVWERRSRCAPGVWLRSLKPMRRFRRLRLPTLFSVSENEPLSMRCACCGRQGSCRRKPNSEAARHQKPPSLCRSPSSIANRRRVLICTFGTASASSS